MTEAKSTPDKEHRYVQLLKTEYMLLAGAACAACETGDTEGLYEVLKALPGLRAIPAFVKHLEYIERQRTEQAARLEELQKPAPKKSAGPSPWGL